MARSLAEWAEKRTILTTYYLPEVPADESYESRYENDQYLGRLIKQLGLVEVPEGTWRQLYRDASGGLVLITETEVSSDV